MTSRVYAIGALTCTCVAMSIIPIFSLPLTHKLPSQTVVNVCLHNQLNMVSACITHDHGADHKFVCDGIETIDLGTISAKHAGARVSSKPRKSTHHRRCQP
jgi:hypothetical protein